MNLYNIVHIRLREVDVYPKGSASVGEDLNRKALITLHQVWPNDQQLLELDQGS